MNQKMQWVWAAVLLLSPNVVLAQSIHAAPGATPPAVVPGAPEVGDDMMMWFGELFGPGDEFELAVEGPDEGPLAFGDMAFEGPEGPEGAEGGGVFAYTDEDGDGGKQVHRNAARGPRARGMMMRHGLAMRFAALDLTDAQREKLRDIHEAAARKSVQRRADVQLARMDLHKLMRAESPTTSAVNTQIDKITRLQADGMKAHFDTFMQARAVLTPEQQKKLRSGPDAMKPRMEHEGHGED